MKLLHLIWEGLIFSLGFVCLIRPTSFIVLLFIVLICLSLVVKWLKAWFEVVEDPLDVDSEQFVDRDTVDPWEYQAQLMEMSNQRIPHTYRLHNGVLLYSALIMEETGETYGGLAKALYENTDRLAMLYSHRVEEASRCRRIARILLEMSEDSRRKSLLIRELLKDVLVDAPLSDLAAVEIFDGTTDIAVVNCGFALSCGFPGAAGYREVVGSNCSKANPASGKIEKTPDGKWIKGPHYFEPDLARVLAEHAGG